MTRETSHVIGANVALVTDSLGVRIKTPTVVTIPPHNITMILLEPPFRALHGMNANTNLFEVIGNPLLSIEQHILHRFGTRYPEQCVAIAVNVGDEDIILNKGITLCVVQETALIMKPAHIKEMDTVKNK